MQDDTNTGLGEAPAAPEAGETRDALPRFA
jgi:hypothetical protein